tara:strand:+ start:338 stop:517 length:180 start_codon:yes stop_codon:yes gene_type:complete
MIVPILADLIVFIESYFTVIDYNSMSHQPLNEAGIVCCDVDPSISYVPTKTNPNAQLRV